MADSIRATPQNPTLGAIAAALRRAQQFTGQYQVDPRVPLLGGTGLDELLSLPGAASLMEDVSYNGPRALIRGGNVATGGIGTFRPDPRVADVADVAMNVTPLGMVAGKAATKGATAVGRAGERMAERVVPSIMERGGVGAQALQALSGGTRSQVVKPKGGNWLAGSIEESIKPMKSYGVINSRQYPYGPEFDAAAQARIASLREAAAQPGYTGGAETVARHLEEDLANPRVRDVAINRWLDSKLTKYIRNEMGTPEDPVRALAERGVLHVEPEHLYYGTRQIHPSGDALEKLAQSPAAKAWENASDYAVASSPAEVYQNFGSSNLGLDWVNKLDPQTPFYRPYGQPAQDLGFSHLIDELKFSMDPNSDLPQRLRFDPKDIDKLTVPQAVERVAKINAWRAEQAAQAEKAGMMANLQATPRMADEGLQLSFVDKPGGAWVDIPETVDEQGMKLCNSIGKAGGWCTQAEWAAKSYGSGDNRLTALVDAEGRPHAQAKITTTRLDTTDLPEAYMGDENALESQYLDNLQALLVQRGVDEERAEDVISRIVNGDELRLPAEMRRLVQELQPEAEAMLPKPQPLLKPDITELKPPGNSFDSDRAKEYMKRDPQYKQKVTESVLKFLNSGEWGKVNDLNYYDIVDLQDTRSLVRSMEKAYHKPMREIAPIFNEMVADDPTMPRFMTTRQLKEFMGPIEDLGHNYAGGGLVKGAVKSIGEMVEKYLAKEAPQAAPKEQKMLMGVYRGYAGEAPGETVYHAGAEFKEPRPGLFTTPERAAAEQFQRFTGAPRLHTLEAKPRRTGTEEDVYAMARRLGIYNPGVPAGQYLEQGENAIFPEAAMMVEELRNQGLDSLRLADGISKKPSLVALDPTVVRPAQEVFATPQRRIAEYYARKRAAQTGAEPHLEMLLVDPFAGSQYGHAIPIDRLNRDVNYTRARKLKPEDVQDRTKLYAAGGAVSAPTASAYDPDEIDTIVSKLKEEFHA